MAHIKVRIASVILVDSRRGQGTNGDPIRRVTTVHSMQGDLVMTIDPQEDIDVSAEIVPKILGDSQ